MDYTSLSSYYPPCCLPILFLLAGLLVLSAPSRLFARDAQSERERRRVAKMNEAIQYDREMENYIANNRRQWSQPEIQAHFGAMQSHAAQLRQELKDLGGHESVN